MATRSILKAKGMTNIGSGIDKNSETSSIPVIFPINNIKATEIMAIKIPKTK